MHTNESAENYLETILILSKQLPVVRSVDIASISVAMKKLKNSGYILVSPKGYITLTKTGKEIADRIYERHTLLTSWLTRLGVDADTAAKDACRIEHVISSQSFEALRNHVKPFSPDEN